MKKKIAYYIFIAAFFTVCIIPSAGMLLLGESEAAANEILAERPSLFTEDGAFNRNITDELTSYMADRFAFRQEFITAYAKLQAAVFRESSSEDVVLGKDGWLFYADTVDDYLHRETISQRSACGIGRTLALMQQYAEKQGAKFVFTVAPNKNSLYPEYMPNVGNVADAQKNLQLVEKSLRACGVEYGDLTAAFQDQPVLYHRLDSHWNNRGAALGLRCITEKLGVSAYSWFDEPYGTVKNHSGDLYKMLFPAGKELDENVIFDRNFAFSYLQNSGPVPAAPERADETSDMTEESHSTGAESTAGSDAAVSETSKADGPETGKTSNLVDYYSEDAPAPDSIKIETVCERGEGNLLMFRDSFGNALYPFMADTFAYAAFSRLIPYRMDWLASGDFDYIVVEIVERNIRNLALKAPIMPAPIASFNSDLKEGGFAEVQTEISVSSEMPGYFMVSGIYDDARIDEDTRVFIDTGAEIYEASPVGSGLGGMATDACFTAYIPESASDGQSGNFRGNDGISEEQLNEIDFSVILCTDGGFYRHPCEVKWK